MDNKESKQTDRLTAEELLKVSGFEARYGDFLTVNKAVELMEQYAKAKVLEALEREVIKARVSKDISIKEKVLKHIVSEEVLDKYISDAQKYYETEVKPLYNK
jgi:hypothetical protein